MSHFCLLHLYLNKEKEIQNKIKKLKRKEKYNETKPIVHNYNSDISPPSRFLLWRN